MKTLKSRGCVYILIFFATVFSAPALALLCQDEGRPPDYCAKVCGALTGFNILFYYFCL